MEKTIKIGSCDFWSPFELRHSVFYDVLVECGYTPIIDNQNPDILFYSVFGDTHQQYHGPIKIWFSGENWGLPNFNECNFALSGYFIDDPRHFRFPLYVKYARNYIAHGVYMQHYDDLSKARDITKIPQKTKFCNFVYSNCDPNREETKLRQQFFYELSKYKKVDSGGGCLNNIGQRIPHKIPFMSEYKFSIAMENSNQIGGIYGYTTEKIFEPMLANSIPIYWGNPYIHKEFNPNAFVSFHDYKTMDEVINRIIEIDNNDDLYREYLSQPFVLDYEKSPLNLKNIITFFKTTILNER